MNTKHTPGPWSCPKGLEVIAADGRVITFIDDGDYREPAEAEANACLIAAAPELLAALKVCLHFCNPMQTRAIAATQEAIAKAEGQPCAP